AKWFLPPAGTDPRQSPVVAFHRLIQSESSFRTLSHPATTASSWLRNSIKSSNLEADYTSTAASQRRRLTRLIVGASSIEATHVRKFGPRRSTLARRNPMLLARQDVRFY